MRLLVTGASGLLGGRLAELLQRQIPDLVGAVRSAEPPPGVHSARLDLLEEGALARLLDRLRPQAVVHAAALARVDLCERDPRAAETANAEAPGRLAAACHQRGLRLIALSTDLVFDGTRPHRTETSPTGPINVYGRTKLAGELAVLRGHPEATVVRVALVSGRGHGSRATATESVAWALRAGRPVRLFTDEYRTPIDAESVADALLRLLARAPLPGVLHLGGPERLSRFELGVRVASVLGLDASLLQAARQVDDGGSPPRAADVSLDARQAHRLLGWHPRRLADAIRDGRHSPP